MQELGLGRIAGPFESPPFSHFKQTPLAMREKSTKGKFRLLHNLSYPYNFESVNFNIPEANYKLQYSSINSALKLIRQMPDCFLAKSDIQDAFRILPLDPDSYHLVGFKFLGKYFYDKCLPMGASSSCKIFERFSSSLAYALSSRYEASNVIKVLDDFLFLGPTKKECQRHLDSFIHLCNSVNVPLAQHKTVAPCQDLIFLGFRLNTSTGIISIPEDKIKDYLLSLESCYEAKFVSLRQLKSLIGKLQFCCAVVPGGRCFLRRLHDRTVGLRNPNKNIYVTKGMRADLAVWRSFLINFNGIEIMQELFLEGRRTTHITTDSSKLGYGGTFGTRFIMGKFPLRWQEYDIQALEMYPIFAIIGMIGGQLQHHRLVIHCDNEAVVHAINNQTCKQRTVMHMMRPMVSILLTHRVVWEAVHVPGVSNEICDLLSRGQIPEQLWARAGLRMREMSIPTQLRPENLRL